MTDIFPGKATLKVGASAGSNEEITNLKLIRWRRIHSVTPQTVMNTKLPVGWHQGHKWIEGEIQVLSEAQDAFRKQAVDYVPDGADNVVIPYFVATLVDQDGQTWTATFDNAIILDVDEPYRDGEDTVWVYRFLAKKLTRTGPA